jgi:type IV pilus assembly protein PilQ
LDEAERLIEVLDKKPIQILIEARLVEVDLDDFLDLGVSWGLAYGSVKNGTNYGIGTSQVNSTAANGFATPTPVNGITNGTAGGFTSPTGPASATSPATGVNLPATNTAGAITFGFVNSTTSLIATLNAMASKNKSRVLSAPKIVTLNSEEAKIEADEQIPFPVTTVTGTGVSQQSFQFVSAGIILTVTPTANAEDQVTLKVNPVVSFPIAGLTAVGPTIKTRSAQTTVIVNDGQTLVVGGLIDQTDTNNIQKVPFFGDIPVLGAFFKHSFKEKNRTELLVFVTPHIVKD